MRKWYWIRAQIKTVRFGINGAKYFNFYNLKMLSELHGLEDTSIHPFRVSFTGCIHVSVAPIIGSVIGKTIYQLVFLYIGIGLAPQ